MREILAFLRRDALVAASYKTNMVMSVGSLLVLIVPMYFVAGALQPIVGDAISSEGGQYFAFVVAGMATYQFVMAAVAALPNAISTGLRTGTFEALLTTRTRLTVILFGMVAYPFVWTVVRALVMLAAGQVLGADYAVGRILLAMLIWGAVTLAYVPFGVLAGALLLLTRSVGPLPGAVLAGSLLLGGVYYPTNVIPSWLERLADFIPLAYGLRALRRVLDAQMPLSNVVADLGMLSLITGVLLVVSLVVFNLALKHARRTGSLAQY